MIDDTPYGRLHAACDLLKITVYSELSVIETDALVNEDVSEEERPRFIENQRVRLCDPLTEGILEMLRELPLRRIDAWNNVRIEFAGRYRAEAERLESGKIGVAKSEGSAVGGNAILEAIDAPENACGPGFRPDGNGNCVPI